MASTTAFQDAIRLLYIFYHGAEPFDPAIQDTYGKFEGKAKLHAMDFWVRYPDYLAYELLDKYEETSDDRFVEHAKSILNSHEPDLRRIPMIRYRFGAFDDINESLSILTAKGLVLPARGEKKNGKIQNYEFTVTALAQELVETVSRDFPVLTWYDCRAKLVREVAGNDGGAALKEKQYRHISYASTNLGSIIPSIKDEVARRLQTI